MFTLLNRKSVLWFLFLFNLVVAVVASVGGGHVRVHGHSLHGSQQVMTAVGMGVVALGAGAALLAPPEVGLTAQHLGSAAPSRAGATAASAWRPGEGMGSLRACPLG